jgi:hypothetical protein
MMGKQELPQKGTKITGRRTPGFWRPVHPCQEYAQTIKHAW